MKKVLLAALTFLSLSAFAQEEKAIVIEKDVAEKSAKKQTQEIVIRSKGDKDKKVTVEINGDKVTINGKPIAEFKDDDITINKRNIMVFDGKNRMLFEPSDMDVYFNGPMKGRLSSSSSSAFLGVTSAVVNEYKNDTKPNGAMITDITNGSAADKAGLKENDIITKIDDAKIASPSDLVETISTKKPKDAVTITYKRDGKEATTKATLGEKKGAFASTYSFSGPNGMARTFTMPRMPKVKAFPRNPADNLNAWDNNGLADLDVHLDNLEGQLGGFDFHSPFRPKIGLKIQDVEEGSGVKVLGTEEESPAEKAGLKKDDIITEINGKVVKNTDDARELLKPEENKNNYTIKAKRNGTAMSFDVKIPKKLKTADL
jgi:serine protease Do